MVTLIKNQIRREILKEKSWQILLFYPMHQAEKEEQGYYKIHDSIRTGRKYSVF